jgi:hypothetical protein
MKEFLYKEEINNIEDKIKISRNNKCYLVINAELETEYSTGSALSSRPRLGSFGKTPKTRSEALGEALRKGLARV